VNSDIGAIKNANIGTNNPVTPAISPKTSKNP